MPADRFKIGSKVYRLDVLDDISLRDLMVFNRQVADMGLSITWADIERISSEMAGLSDKKASQHPEAMIMTGVSIWASRRAAGDDVTFEEAVDIPVSEIVWLEGPKDHKPSAKARRSPSARPAKKPGAASSLPDQTTPETSESRSVSA